MDNVTRVALHGDLFDDFREVPLRVFGNVAHTFILFPDLRSLTWADGQCPAGEKLQGSPSSNRCAVEKTRRGEEVIRVASPLPTHLAHTLFNSFARFAHE